MKQNEFQVGKIKSKETHYPIINLVFYPFSFHFLQTMFARSYF